MDDRAYGAARVVLTEWFRQHRESVLYRMPWHIEDPTPTPARMLACARGQGAGGGTKVPDSTGLKPEGSRAEGSIAASQPSQSIPSALSSESQIAIR